MKYIRLAAFLAGQPAEIECIRMSIPEIEEVVGERLPANARLPSWWRNDERKMLLNDGEALAPRAFDKASFEDALQQFEPRGGRGSSTSGWSV